MAKWDKKIKRENGVKWSGVVNLLNCARTPIFYTTRIYFARFGFVKEKNSFYEKKSTSGENNSHLP